MMTLSYSFFLNRTSSRDCRPSKPKGIVSLNCGVTRPSPSRRTTARFVWNHSTKTSVCGCCRVFTNTTESVWTPGCFCSTPVLCVNVASSAASTKTVNTGLSLLCCCSPWTSLLTGCPRLLPQTSGFMQRTMGAKLNDHLTAAGLYWSPVLMTDVQVSVHIFSHTVNTL